MNQAQENMTQIGILALHDRLSVRLDQVSELLLKITERTRALESENWISLAVQNLALIVEGLMCRIEYLEKRDKYNHN